MTSHTLGTLAANGSTTGVRVKNTNRDVENIYTIVAQGTFDTSTITFETSFDGGTTYISVGSDGVFTANGQANIQINSDKTTNTLVRATMSSAGGSSSVTCYLVDSR